MRNSNFGFGDGFDDNDGGFGSGYGDGYGYGFNHGSGYGDGYDKGFDHGDIDSWIKIGRIGNKTVSVLSQWPYMKIGNEIKSLNMWTT